jgi:hypothetical protein
MLITIYDRMIICIYRSSLIVMKLFYCCCEEDQKVIAYENQKTSNYWG